MNYEKKYKSALEWMRSIYPTMQRAEKEDAEHFFPELRESEDEMVRKELIELVRNHARLSISGKMVAWLEKQGEKKSSWSEEDEKMCQETIDWFEKKCFPYALESENPARESIKWLKSLKGRVQPKQEWNEDDERIYNEIIDFFLGDVEKRCTTIDKQRHFGYWLKSLKPRWKPTEEQISELGKAAILQNVRFNKSILKSLYNDLKSL